MKLLIQAGANVNMADKYDKTPLIHTAGNSSVNTVEQYRCIMTLLRAGAYINKANASYRNALDEHLTGCQPARKPVAMLLFAAGELSEITAGQDNVHIPDYLHLPELKVCLKHVCRESIRRYLIDLNLKSHSFYRTPKLGLPSLLNEYLLYDISLDDELNEEVGKDS